MPGLESCCWWPRLSCSLPRHASSAASAGEQSPEYLLSFARGHTVFCLSQLPVSPAASAGEQSLKYLWYLTVDTVPKEIIYLLRGPHSSSFWLPRNLFNHIDRQARTRDAVLKSRETTGRSQTLPWWLGGEGVKTTENKIHWPRCLAPSVQCRTLHPSLQVS